jgi:hypothetical protein
VKEENAVHSPLETQSLTAERFFRITEDLRSKALAVAPGKLRCTIDDKNHPASANIVRVYSRLTDAEKSHFEFIMK